MQIVVLFLALTGCGASLRCHDRSAEWHVSSASRQNSRVASTWRLAPLPYVFLDSGIYASPTPDSFEAAHPVQ